MKIKNISCTQFAGIRDKNISFTDGINVIYGKNESGKSTLVNLISRTLFQNARLDRRSDKDFYDLYFPSLKKGGNITGDFVDGKITFEAENGSYTLSKEWGLDFRSTLSTPEGVVRDQSTIDEILKEALIYGEGVYSDMLFSSQRNTDASLQTILDASKKTNAKQEITEAVSQAFAESDGISVDAIEQGINAKIDEIAGKHWDFEGECPLRKAGGGKWSKDLGEILKAYYAFEDAKAVLREISRLELEADLAAKEYVDKDNAAGLAEEAYNRFNTFASQLTLQSERKKSIDRIDKELQKIAEVLAKWPKTTRLLEKAKELKNEKSNRAIIDAWSLVNQIRRELTDEDLSTAELPYPENMELNTVRRAQRELTSLENKLCGMNLTAAINMLGDNTVEVTSLRTGKVLDISGGMANITEAVKITIPNVMEMQLAPADMDVDATKEQITVKKKIIADIFAKYKVKSLEELEIYAQKIENTKAKIENVNNRIARVLGDISLEQLEELYEVAGYELAGKVNRTKEEIEGEIHNVCYGMDVATFITKAETRIENYTAEYGSINDLKAKAFDLESELKKAKDSLTATEDIPAEYSAITDPEAHLEALQKDLKFRQSLRESALNTKTASASKLESYKENLQGDPAEDVERAERIYKEQKALLYHWMHINQVFKVQKESIHNNPMQDIAESFSRYLGVISGGRVESEFPEADRLNMNVYSDNKLMDYGKLSEGTKETVSLAFRLAVLDHLFPNGGGVILLDDPFTDMDAERTTQSCKLIKECANRHQVIFLTCREEYLDMLSGNEILM